MIVKKGRAIKVMNHVKNHILFSLVKCKPIYCFVPVSNNPFIFLTHSARILPLASAVRESIITAIQQNCSKIKNLVFAVLIANNKLIALVRMKKYFIHPADLR